MNPQVYFASAEQPGCPIKIGHSIDVEKRLKALQTSSPETFVLLASVPGDTRAEFFFHSLVSRHRISGEWFKPAPELLLLIDDIKAKGEEVIPPLFRLRKDVVHKKKIDGNEIIQTCLRWIECLSEPLPFGENMADTLIRISKTTGVPVRTLKSIWYGETLTIRAESYLGLREAFEARMSKLWKTESH